ncbi:discoidin domain-containing protein [Candidatus Saccharibacteria bacterium]|nr:discoidin domain-containing protein [Candidatus Saccharibacteria bacterium]
MGNFWKKINTVFTKINTKLSKTVISLKDPKKIAKKHISTAKKISQTKTYKKTKHYTKRAHHHVAARPHNYLMSKSKRYAAWHGWQHHGKVHVAIAAVFTIVFVGLRLHAYAVDTGFIWTFETPGDYTFDGNKVESNNNDLRLSLEDKIENFTLAGGKLQSNNVLDVAADDTYYFVSNSLGIDVIRQDTWERTAYITSGGGFPTIIVENGYIYAGKNGGIYRWQVSALTNNTPLGSYRYTTSTTPALGHANVTDMDSEVIDGKTYIAVANQTHISLIKDDLGTNTIVKGNVSLVASVYGVAITSDNTLYYGMRGAGSTPVEPIMVKYNASSIASDWSYNQADVDYGIQDRVAGSTTHGPDPASGAYLGLRVTVGTSTANAGDNTLYIETQEGLSIIHENRTTPASGTVNNFTHDSRGANLLTGANTQSRFTTSSPASRTIDGNLGTYYYSVSSSYNAANWVEYDLGTSLEANLFRHFLWTDDKYNPDSYTVEASTTGTSPNLSTSSTAIGQWPLSTSFSPEKGIDDSIGTDYISKTSSSHIENQLYEVRYDSPQEVGAVDMQFRESSRRGRNYVIEGSSNSTSDPVVPVSATASSSVSGSTDPSKAFDANIGTKWEAAAAPSVAAPQWINYDFGSSKTIAGLHFVTTDSNSQAAKAYTVEYSDDSSNWQTAYTETSQTTKYGRVSFSPITARYIRLHFTETQLGGRIVIHESEFFESMFEGGTVTQLAEVTSNDRLAKLSTFTPTSVKSIRIRATGVGDSTGTLGVREMRTHTTSFESGTVTNLLSPTNMSWLAPSTSYTRNHDMGFSTPSVQYIRLSQDIVPSGGMLVSEARLHNSTLPEWFPSLITAGAVNTETNSYYAILNTTAPEDGRMLKIDGATINSPSITDVIDVTTEPDLASDEFTSVHIVDSNRMITGTSDGGAAFIGKRYATDLPTIEPNDSYNPAAVASWNSFTEDANKNGGEIYYQISNDDGVTWYYWNGSTWAETGANDRNIATDIDAHIDDFPIGTREFKWRAYLESNGSQEVNLHNVEITINPDITPPTSNAHDIEMYIAESGAQYNQGDWVTTNTPYFSWGAGEDDSNPGASGIKGYCLYLGQSDTADPVSDKGILGTSPLDTDSTCPFAVAYTEIDLSTSGYLASALTSSTNSYYLHIKALDYSNNLYTGSSESFDFLFDNTVPTAPGFISAPAQFLATRDVTLTWPTTGSGSVSDDHSGVLGLQYRIGGEGTWYGSGHTGTQDVMDVLPNNGTYRTDETYDYPVLIEGNNIIYFRTVDNAGNFSSTYATAVIKINTAAPSSPQNVSVTPSTNTTNAFAFNWDAPSTFVGQASTLEYCYTVNTLPTSNTCNFTEAGVTSISTGPYATQPGENTFYVVAKDEADNINYATAASVTFTANTSAPGMPSNVEIADISTKATSNWKVALSWALPVDQGAGIANYRIYRSADNSNFTQIATTSGLSYVDSDLSQTRYYYKIKACDSANNCGAYSSVVNMFPTGKFTEPATLIAKPEVSGVTTKRATIKWSTNRESDSKVAIGTSRGNYFASEISNSSQVTAHSLELDNLSAGTTYYLVTRWTDEDGNTGVSDELSFSTAPAPFVKEAKTIKVGLQNATIQFTSKDASRAVINYGKTDALGGQVEINTSTEESVYNVELPDLTDGTKYFYRVSLLDTEGGNYPGDLYSFTTPPRPRISDLKFQPIPDEPTSTQLVSWKTNVPASSIVSYGVDGTPGKDISDNALVTDHEIIIRDLLDDSNYYLIAQSRDAGGNQAVSDRQTFKTALDTRPPKITEVTTETTIRGTGAEARGQIIVSWKTDEPSTSQVAYAEGSSASEFNNRSSEDTALATEHIVIVSDLPTSRVYSIKPVSKDNAKNEAEGESQSAIIGRASDDVITIVLNTLKKVFGF